MLDSDTKNMIEEEHAKEEHAISNGMELYYTWFSLRSGTVLGGLGQAWEWDAIGGSCMSWPRVAF